MFPRTPSPAPPFFAAVPLSPRAPPQALAGRNKYAIFILAFSVVLREGTECVVFMAGLGATSSVKALPIPGVVGFILGLIFGYVLFFR